MTATAPVYLIAGALTGGVYFFLLYSAVLNQVGRATRLGAPALHIIRFGLAGLTFWIVAKHGAMPLLLCLAGFLLARVWAIRRFGAI